MESSYLNQALKKMTIGDTSQFEVTAILDSTYATYWIVNRGSIAQRN